MADFCSFCYYTDIDYPKLIIKHLDKIHEGIELGENITIFGGICEGCCSTNITITKDMSVLINGRYIGNITEDGKFTIDEESDEFKINYLEKKLRSEKELFFINREMMVIKHITYANYLLGGFEDNKISDHDCVSFEDFIYDNFKEEYEKGWEVYHKLNGSVA